MASAPPCCFSEELAVLLEETLYYFKDEFPDAMNTLGKDFDEYYFEQWSVFLNICMTSSSQ